MLLAAGADVNDKNGYRTALVCCLGHEIDKNCLRIIRLLLDAGADVNARSAFNETSLTVYLNKNNIEKYTLIGLKMLIAAGADISVLYNFKWPSNMKGRDQVLKILLDSGFIINCKYTHINYKKIQRMCAILHAVNSRSMLFVLPYMI